MLSGALIFLVNTVFDLFTAALMLRVYMQWARAPYRNPLSEFLGALTDFAVRPARRFIPGLWGIDLATLAVAWLAQFIALAIVFSIKGYQLGGGAGLALAALVLMAGVVLVKILIYIVMVTVIMQAVLTWVNPYSPVMPLLNSLSRPFLRRIQRLVPPIGNVDISPLIVVIACQLLLMVPVALLEGAIMRIL
jgi:YggT family protein